MLGLVVHRVRVFVSMKSYLCSGGVFLLELSQMKVIYEVALYYFWKASSRKCWQKDSFKLTHISNLYRCFWQHKLGLWRGQPARWSGLITFLYSLTKVISDLSCC